MSLLEDARKNGNGLPSALSSTGSREEESGQRKFSVGTRDGFQTSSEDRLYVQSHLVRGRLDQNRPCTTFRPDLSF